MIANNIVVEELSRDGKLKMPITTLFIGSYELAIELLTKLTNFNDDEAVATKFWRVQFDDPETERDYHLLWSEARCIDGWWLVNDCVEREWLIDAGGVRLEECVAITFASRRLRKAFMAHTDH
jgi:hypothetical protein